MHDGNELRIGEIGEFWMDEEKDKLVGIGAKGIYLEVYMLIFQIF